MSKSMTFSFFSSSVSARRALLRVGPLFALAALVLASIALALGACGADPDTDQTHDAIGVSPGPPPPDPDAPWTLDGEPCGDPFEVTLSADAELRESFGVARADARVQGTRSEMTLRSEGGESEGTFAVEVALDSEVTSGAFTGFRIAHTLHEGDTLRAAQRWSGRNLSGSRILLEIEHQAGEQTLQQWAVLTPEWELERMSIGIPWEGGDESEALLTRTPDGEVLDTLLIVDGSGTRLDPEAVDAWVRDRIGNAFDEDAAWQRLLAAGRDQRLRDALDANLRLCRAAGIEEAEASFFGIGMGGPACAPDAEGRIPKSCRSDDLDRLVTGLETLLTINDGMGHISTGALITGALVAAGVVASGPAIGAAFVGATIASVLVSNAIENFTARHSDEIIGGLVTGGTVLTGGTAEEARTTRNFFAGSGGDPWFDTFDGLAYGFHGAGEYILIESTGPRPFTVQVRHEPARGECSGVALTTAVALQVGSRALTFQVEGDAPIRLDGAPLSLPGGVLPLSDGVVLETIGAAGDRWEIRWPSGERLLVMLRRQGFLDVRVALPDSRRDGVQGLLGNFNGDRDDDMRTRDGLRLDQPIHWEDLHGAFGDSWRIDPDESLFWYPDGTSNETFLLPDFPTLPTRVGDLDPTLRDDAETTCREAGISSQMVLNACIIDVVCMGESDLADSHADRTPEAELEVDTEPRDRSACVTRGEQLYDVFDVDDEPGDPIPFACPPDCYSSSRTRVRGIDVYMGDSYICAAAIHAGLFTNEEGGALVFRPLTGASSYPGSLRNGIQSSSYSGSWRTSFVVEEPPVDPCNLQGRDLVDRVTEEPGPIVPFACPPGCGQRGGSVWGTDVYTDDSRLCRAAVHAGIIVDPLGGRGYIQSVPPLDAYESSTRNGITSSTWGSWPGAFVLFPPDD